MMSVSRDGIGALVSLRGSVVASTVAGVQNRAARAAARRQVAAYHQARLAELVATLGEAIDRFRAGEADAFETDAAIHHYTQAARKLWVFCDQSGSQVEFTADLIDQLDAEGEAIDWWNQQHR